MTDRHYKLILENQYLILAALNLLLEPRTVETVVHVQVKLKIAAAQGAISALIEELK